LLSTSSNLVTWAPSFLWPAKVYRISLPGQLLKLLGR